MLSSCRAETENQHALTEGNNGIAPEGSQKPVSILTVRQMCKQAPHAFQVNWPVAKPSQTLEQWAELA